MKYFVNSLTAFRICAAFAIIPTLMFGMYWTTFILFALASISDWLDGFLARKYDVCTKLGGVLDHIGDKLLVVNTLIMLAIQLSIFLPQFGIPAWTIFIPTVIMIARELYISGLREFLGTQKIEMPVPKARFSMGKIKTTLQMIALVVFLLWLAVLKDNLDTNNIYMIMLLGRTIPMTGVWVLWFALVASLWSATQYTFTFIQKLKKIK